MGEPIVIIKGQDKEITARAQKKDGSFVDITNATLITACFVPAVATDHILAIYLPTTGDIVNASDIISNIPDTSLLMEGMDVEGAGIPFDVYGKPAVILKTPTSTVSPTAPGTVKISLPATATTPSLAIKFGNVKVTDGPTGAFTIKIKKAETVLLKKAPLTALQQFEATYVIDGETSKSQSGPILNIIESIC